MRSISEFYSDEGPERVGVILNAGEVVEVTNRASDPFNTFSIDPDWLRTHESEIVATWHTHPNSPANLSFADYTTFLAWPQFDHYIVGSDVTLRFYVEENIVYCGEEETSSSRLSG